MNSSFASDLPSKNSEHLPYSDTPQTSSLELSDIYYTLFRHKWKILLTTIVGFGAAYGIVHNAPKLYKSEARLLIRYIREEKSITADPGTGVKTPGDDSIVGAEIAILGSLDVAQKTADTIGYDKILGAPAGPESKFAAGGAILEGLDVKTVGSSTVLEVSFKHTNSAVVQPVLVQLITQYFQSHREVHTPSGAFEESLMQQTEILKTALRETEKELLVARTKAGISSLVEARTQFSQQMSMLKNNIFILKAELAERQVTLKRFSEAIGMKLPDPEKQASEPPVDTGSLPIAEYQELMDSYMVLKREKQETLRTYTEESSRIKGINARLEGFEKKKAEMEKAHPALLQVAPKPTAGSEPKERRDGYDPVMENARIQAAAIRIQVLEAQLKQIQIDSAEVDKAELNIQELERRKVMQENNYRYLQTSLEQARINDSLGTGRVTNISQIQHPSPPFRVADKSIKTAAILAVGGIVLGIAWAFAIELFLDRTIKRPIDISRHTGLSLFLSIPDIGKKRRRLQNAAAKKALLADKSDAAVKKGSEQMTNGSSDETGLQPYYDTLRDRVIGFFESENLTHKPKLIALAGVGQTSSDTTVAAGLASSLSETEGGNVLFVDMTSDQGSTQQFFKGEAIGSIDEALEAKDKSQVQDNLYVVSEVAKGDRLPRALPMRFNHLIPKLKASDFDFIIFNMPPVSSVSVTPRLAAFMDVVLLIIESEKADRDHVTRARDLLAKSKTPVGAVLNKTRSYVPKALYQDSAEQR